MRWVGELGYEGAGGVDKVERLQAVHCTTPLAVQIQTTMQILPKDWRPLLKRRILQILCN